MKGMIKGIAEQLSGNRVWLERATDPAELQRFIHSIRPRSTTTPLIRVGGSGDGGYLLPDDLDGIRACVSPGISAEISFDKAVAARGIDVFMADATVEGPPEPDSRFHFLKKHLDVVDGAKTTRLDTLCQSMTARFDGDLLLQMDIEGAEYRVLLDTSEDALRRFRIIVIEFHHLTQAFGRFPFEMIKATFTKLLRFHYVVHAHPNNISGAAVRGDLAIPPVMEFTFHRKDRTELDEGRPLAFPHPLDVDNLPNRPSVTLPACWQ